MDTRLLEEIGLTNGESKVYLALLELGPSTTGEIIKVASVSRSKVYEMLDKLIKYGLVSYIVRENTKYYDTTNPGLLRELLDRKEKDILHQKRILSENINYFIKKRGSRRPLQTAVIYEGHDGIRTMYNLILENLKAGDEYFAIQVDPETFKGDFVEFIKTHHKRRAKRKVKVRLLCSEESRKNVLDVMKNISGMEIRFTSRSLPTATLVFGDRVATFVWENDPIGVVIVSKAIAMRYKKFFLYLWKTASK